MGQPNPVWRVTVGSARCPACGEKAVEEHRPDLWKRLRYWITHGEEASTRFACNNGHSWSPSSRSVRLLRRMGPPGWFSVPGALLSVLLIERSKQPIPVTYVLALGVGVLIGVGLDQLVGWDWWVVAIGFVILVWLYFLSTAFPGCTQETIDRLIGVVNPEKAHQRRKQRLAEAAASGSLVAYEVVGWRGRKFVGGWGGPLDNPRSLTIGHTDPDDVTKHVNATVNTGDGPWTDANWLEDHLAGRLLDATEGEPPTWQTASMPIDGEATQGRLATASNGWMAHFTIQGRVVYLVGQGVAPSQISLRRITTFDSYI